ncbi:hypothetical protein M758_3G064100 [Ceratodon purpureus]|nr:hypothetical protein M758_3G064100 [Ceratodon purpureus]
MITMARISTMGVTWCAIFVGILLLGSLAEGHTDLEASTDGAVNLRARSLVVAKCSALVVVFGVAFLGSILPYFCRKSSSFLLLGTQFAGGVFLSTALMHFLFDADVTFKFLLPSAKYSFAAMFTIVGYLLTMLADVLVHRVYNHRAFQQLRKEDLELATEGPETKAAILKTMNLFDTVLLILTLCFHSVFDGLTIGVAATTGETWKEMWMVGLHKFLLAIALGIIVLRLASNRPLLNSLLYGFAFSISTSVGIAIGILINTTAEGSTADWIFAVWMGIGTGVFVYVVINHLLAWDNHKLLHKEQALFRWLAVLFGAIVSGVVLIWD